MRHRESFFERLWGEVEVFLPQRSFGKHQAQAYAWRCDGWGFLGKNRPSDPSFDKRRDHGDVGGSAIDQRIHQGIVRGASIDVDFTVDDRRARVDDRDETGRYEHIVHVFAHFIRVHDEGVGFAHDEPAGPGRRDEKLRIRTMQFVFGQKAAEGFSQHDRHPKNALFLG